MTDSARRRFFRKHFSTPSISFCGLDPEDRRWTEPQKKPGVPADPEHPGPAPTRRIFGFVSRRSGSGPTGLGRTGRFGGGGGGGHCNQCHLFAEQDPEQPAKAIVNFVNKVLLQQQQQQQQLGARASARSQVV